MTCPPLQGRGWITNAPITDHILILFQSGPSLREVFADSPLPLMQALLGIRENKLWDLPVSLSVSVTPCCFFTALRGWQWEAGAPPEQAKRLLWGSQDKVLLPDDPEHYCLQLWYLQVCPAGARRAAQLQWHCGFESDRWAHLAFLPTDWGYAFCVPQSLSSSRIWLCSLGKHLGWKPIPLKDNMIFFFSMWLNLCIDFCLTFAGTKARNDKHIATQALVLHYS